MKLGDLLVVLNDIKDRFDAYNADVIVEGWDDNAYDGDAIEGVRVIIDDEAGQRKTTVFVIKGQGRKSENDR